MRWALRISLASLLPLVACTQGEKKTEPAVDLANWMPRRSSSTLPGPTSGEAEASFVSAPEGAEAGPAEARDEPPAVPPWEPHGALVIGLEEVLERAATTALPIEAARRRLDVAAAEHSIARSAWLPTVSPGGGFRYHSGEIQATPGDIFSTRRQSTALGAGVELRLDPARAWLEQRAADEREDAQREGLRGVSQDTLYAAALGFFDLVEAVAQIHISEHAVAHAEELREIQQARVEHGAGLEVDRLRAEARLAGTRRDLLRVENDAAIASALLAELLLLDETRILVPDEHGQELVEMVGELPLEELLQQASDQRPELSQAQALQRAREEEETLAAMGWMIPELEVAGWWGSFGHNLGDQRDRQDYVAGLRWHLDASLFGARDKAVAEREEAEITTRMVRRRIAAEVVQAVRTVQSSRGQVSAGQVQVQAAREARELAIVRHKAGSGLLIEVLDAEVVLTRAELALAGATADSNRAQFMLLRALGGRP